MLGDEADVSALQVAALAGVLLVVVVGADAVLNRTVSLQVETDTGWQTMAQLPPTHDDQGRDGTLVETNRSEDVDFRVVVDNRRLDTFHGEYEIREAGQRLAEGTLQADRLGVDHSTFAVAGETLLDREGPDDRGPRPVTGVSLEMLVQGETAHAWLEVREVAG